MTELQQAFPEVHSKLMRQADAEKLFESFMKIMSSPPDTYYDGTLDNKLKTLYEDGQKYGFK
jgi:hypothetical protein